MRLNRVFLCALLALASSAAASASTIFSATLDPTQAGTIAMGGMGSGFATVTLNDAMTMVDVFVQFSGLTDPAIAAHIHCCAPPGVAAGVVVPFPSFPNAISGTYTQTDLAIAPADVTGLLAGLAYVNIHDTTFPAGEIRGQLSQVPEPSTAGLLGVGLLLMIFKFRRAPRRA